MYKKIFNNCEIIESFGFVETALATEYFVVFFSHRWAEQLKVNGHLLAEKQTGRPEKLSALDLRLMKLAAARNPESTVRQVAGNAGVNISHNTTVKYLKRIELSILARFASNI